MKSISTRAFGRDAQGLLTVREYAALRGGQRSLAETLGMDQVVELPVVTLAVDTITWAQ